MDRRRFLSKAATGVVAAVSASHARAHMAISQESVFRDLDEPSSRRTAGLEDAGFTVPVGEGTLSVLSDGHMQLPASWLRPDGVDSKRLDALLQRYHLNGDAYLPDCNITLWQTPDHTVLFDVGGGAQFMSTLGQLPMALEEAGIDPGDITDVVLTHAHPDHLWGLLDDFDDLLYPDANYHIHSREAAYWMADDTLGKTPEARQTFVVGAQARLPLIEERLSRYEWGDEILPGVEAVDTHGHTPGHTSFALHQGGDSLLVVGDALSNIALSFEQPSWASVADQDPEAAARTRLALLDRLATDQMRIVGFHLPTPGFGRAERNGSGAYRFVAEEK